MKPLIGLFIICLLIIYVFILKKKKIKKKIIKEQKSFHLNLWEAIKYLPLIFSYIMIPGW